MKDSIDHMPPALAADLAFRRRALTVNCNIYALRHAPRFVPLLTRGMRGRYIARVTALGTERACTPEHFRRVATLADEIDALGSQRPRIAETCRWHSATEDKFPRAVLPGTFDFGFATALSQKDVRLCCEEAETMGVPMLAGNLVRQMLAVTKAKFGAESDFTSMVKVIEEWAGVEIRG
jgi:hypothetical protein